MPIVKREELKGTVVPRQKWLFDSELDPTNSLPVEDVLQEVWEHVPAYMKLCRARDKQHETVTLDEILTLSVWRRS